MTDLLIKLLLAYLLGSVLGSMLMGRLRGGVDIRTQGSGNAGGTNALRTQGAAFAAGVMLIDIGKGVLAAWLLPRLPLASLWDGDALAFGWQGVWCGIAVVLGHVYPVWYGFRGGKGAATLVGVLLVLAAWMVVPVLAIFAVVLVFTGYVSLSTIAAAASTLIWLLLFTTDGWLAPLGAFAWLMTLFIAFTHRSNIQRLLAGTENRFEKAMLFKRRPPA